MSTVQYSRVLRLLLLLPLLLLVLLVLRFVAWCRPSLVVRRGSGCFRSHVGFERQAMLSSEPSVFSWLLLLVVVVGGVLVLVLALLLVEVVRPTWGIPYCGDSATIKDCGDSATCKSTRLESCCHSFFLGWQTCCLWGGST